MHNTIKIALFTPVSPVRSGLVDHIESLLPALLQHLDITVVTDGSYEPSSPLFVGGGRSQIPWITYQDFGQAPERFDLVIYQLGNEPNIHGYMFDAIHRYPGILILHDLVLHHAIAELTLSRGRADEYRAEIRYSYGARGDELVQQVMAGREREIFARYPLIERILDSSLGVITSNGYMTRYVKKARPALPVCHIPLHLCLPDDLPTEQEVLAYRRRLGLNDKRIIGTTGLYNPNNRLDIALRAFARVIARHPDVVYLLVGAPQDESALRARIASLGLNEHVRMTGWVPADEFVKSMLLLDIGVQLRYPHVGGMSYPPLHLMALGVPVIISDIEPMMDIPANAVIRIPPNHPDEETLLFSAIDRLLSDPASGKELAENGHAFISEQHNSSAIVKQFVSFIRQVDERQSELVRNIAERRRTVSAINNPLRERLVQLAGAALADLGTPTNREDLLAPIAEMIAGLIGDNGEK